MRLCPTTALVGAAPCWYCCGARGWLGGAGAVLCVHLLPSLFVLGGYRGVYGGLSCLGFPCACLLVPHSMLSAWFAMSVRGPFWVSPRALCVLVRARWCVACVVAVRLRCAPPPPTLFPVRALRDVSMQGADRAVPCCLCPSLFPTQVHAPCLLWWGGGVASRSSFCPACLPAAQVWRPGIGSGFCGPGASRIKRPSARPQALGATPGWISGLGRLPGSRAV